MDEIHHVAVVGAGISGVCSAAHLLKQGLSVTLFERTSTTGGVWHFDSESAHEPGYPNETASRGDYEKVFFHDSDAYTTPPLTPKCSDASDHKETRVGELGKLQSIHLKITHAPPGPCYAGLRNNVALTAMKTTLGDWPEGLDEFVNQRYLDEYIQSLALGHGVNGVTRFDTRVEDIAKIGSKWRVHTTTYVNGPNALPNLIHDTTFVDAVVVASGHYHMPRIPDIPGLKEWKQRFPDRIQHSKGYRSAEKYRDSNILIIGAGVSSMDIAKEIDLVGGKVYQSSRGGTFDLPASSLPNSAERVSGVSSFTTIPKTPDMTEAAAGLPGRVSLSDGTFLSNIDYIILATGYITSYPFLPDKHSDDRICEEAGETLLVTKEGNMVHNLHKDIFYIQDPTLAFVGVPYHVSTFSLFDFQAQVVARVFAGKAQMPARAEMRAEYNARAEAKGLGREFHSLRATGAEIEYVEDLVDWMNEGLWENDELMIGHTREWHEAHRRQRELLAKRFGGKLEEWLPKLRADATIDDVDRV